MTAAIRICIALSLAAPLAAQRDIGPAPGRLVDVGDYRLHLNCTGAGSPTVVLASGASAFAIDWALVQPEVAHTNRVCSYDRAGMGWSDSTGVVPTAERSVHELYTLLKVAGERPPYVLVAVVAGSGHEIHLFHPGAVTGAILDVSESVRTRQPLRAP